MSLCYGLNYIPPTLYVEALSLNVMVFTDRTFREVIQVIGWSPNLIGLMFF